MGGVPVWQDELEGVGGHFDPGLGRAIGIEGVDAADAGAVGFDQAQAVEIGGGLLPPEKKGQREVPPPAWSLKSSPFRAPSQMSFTQVS